MACGGRSHSKGHFHEGERADTEGRRPRLRPPPDLAESLPGNIDARDLSPSSVIENKLRSGAGNVPAAEEERSPLRGERRAVLGKVAPAASELLSPQPLIGSEAGNDMNAVAPCCKLMVEKH